MMRPVVILVAGWAHTAADMAALSSALGPGFEVRTTTPDELRARGGGSSYAMGLNAMVSDAAGPCCLAGWSMGAMIILEAVGRLSVSAERIVILAGTPRFCAGPGFSAGMPAANLRALRAAMRRNPTAALAGFFRDVAFPRALLPGLAERKADDAVAGGIAGLDDGLRYLQDTDLRDDLARVRVPALVLHGREDRIVPWQAGEWLGAHLPQGSFAALDQAGHDLAADMPDAVGVRVRDFLGT